ncbi:MAG: urease accessory protein UreD [Pseudomonadota bacterium]
MKQNAMSAAVPDAAGGWQAALSLRFTAGADRTRMHREVGCGPLYVQKPFYPEGPVCHAYLLHPPGGVVGGDALRINVAVETQASALLTTPASSKFYRSTGALARQDIRMSVDDDASCEYLPQGTIVFPGARVRSSALFQLAPHARLVTADVLCLGQPANDQRFDQGSYEQHLRIERRDPQTGAMRPLLSDRLRFKAGASQQQAPWGLDGRYCLGTCYATPVDADQLALLRERHPRLPLTCVRSVLIARLLDDDPETVSLALRALWSDLRPMLLQRPALAPAIWRT